MDMSSTSDSPRRARSLRRTVVHATVTVSALVTVVSCSGTESGGAAPGDTTGQYRSPEQIQGATVVWSAEPGIHLQDERGSLVRAAEESWIIARYVGPENSYPGFAGVLDPASASVITPLPDRHLAGTLRAHLLSVTSTDTGFDAVVCTQRSELAERWPDGRYHFTSAPDIESIVRFTRTSPTRGDGDTAPTGTRSDTKQTSSQRVWQSPATDLFTGTGWSIAFSADPGGTRQRCQAWGRSIHTGAAGAETTDVPPRVLPALPGW